MEKDKYKIGLFILLIFLAIFSVYALRPQIAGDSLLYTSSIEVLRTGVQPPGFVPMMIVSTYFGLRLIMFLDFFIENIAISWLVLDGVLYIAMGLFFYSLLKKIVGSAKTAFWGTLFLATNYAAVSFGLGYLMDMGGWAFYVASLYFSYRYLESENGGNKWLFISSALVGVGGLYKEYAFVAYVIIFGLIVFKDWKNLLEILKKTIITGCLAFGPFFLLNVYGFFAFHYTYLDWFFFNQGAYDYQNRFVEFIKSFGSIYNFGWFLFIGGFYLLLKRSREMFRERNINKDTLFLWLVILSCFSVLLWPVVTRILFITMPAAVMVSSLLIRKMENRIYIIAPLLLLYVISSYLMDAYVLDFVNLPL